MYGSDFSACFLSHGGQLSCYATHLSWHLRLRMSLACVMLQFHRLFKPHFCFYSAGFLPWRSTKLLFPCTLTGLRVCSCSCWAALWTTFLMLTETSPASRTEGLVLDRAVVGQLSSASSLWDERNPWEPLPVQLREASAVFHGCGWTRCSPNAAHSRPDLLRNTQTLKCRGFEVLHDCEDLGAQISQNLTPLNLKGSL